jgi:hypothetical protein
LGADESLRTWGPEYTTFQGAVIHHTDGTNDYQESDVPAIIRGIYYYHTKIRGWGDIGYNYLVDKFGVAWEGRTDGISGINAQVIGAHTYHYNDVTFGVSILGTYNNVAASSAAIQTASNVIAWKFSAIGVSSAYGSFYDARMGTNVQRVSGHRDLYATTCPGNVLYSQLNTIRANVQHQLSANISLVKSSGSSVVYLVSGNTKYPVKDWASYQLLSRLGSLQTVSDNYLSSLPTGAIAGNILRDSQTGTIYQITSAGQKNSFPSCTLLHSFTNLVCDASQMPNLTTSALNEFSTGPGISSFIKTAESPTVYYFTGTQLRAVTSWNDAISLNSGTPPTPYVGTQEDLTRLTIGAPIYTPGTLVKTKTSPQVYVVDGWDSLIPLGSFQVSTALGLGTTVTTLQTTTLPAGYTATTTQLSPQVSQGGTTYLGLDGTLRKLENSKTTGLTTTPITAATKNMLTDAGTISSTKVFLKTQSSGTVYLLSNGTLNPLGTWATAIAQNNGTTPTITTVTQQTLSAFTTGTTLFAPGTAVVSTGNPAVYLIDSATTKIYVTSLETLTDLGIQLVRTTDTAALKTYTQTTTPLTNIVTCNNTIYIAGNGTLWRLSQPTTTLGALTTTPLSTQTCATLHTETQPQQHVFLKTATSPDVYYLTNGKKQRISTWAQAITTNNNTPPTPITLQPHDLTTIPTTL